MSYTLRGRLESRLAAGVLPFAIASVVSLALHVWWPVELAGVMVGVGLVLDVLVYHRLLPYQPGWAAAPLGLLELAIVIVFVRLLDIAAPFETALWFFAGSWLLAQLLGHAVLPLLRLSYGEDGGELGRGGYALGLLAPASILAVLGAAFASQPPTVRLEAGTHAGPLVLDSSQKLVGDDGAIVRGGIVIRSDDVTVRNVTVLGGEVGISVDGVDDVLLDNVRVVGSTMDGINVRRGEVSIRNCSVQLTSPFAQGIDISFSFDKSPSLVDGCTVEAPWEGIVSHFAQVRFRDNTVRRTGLRAITVTEMSMGHVERNRVESARGVGIFCGDYSQCEIERNTVTGTMPARGSDDGTRAGYAIQAHFGAVARLEENRLERNARGESAFSDARIERD
jgi:hypothetical protein